MVKIVWTELSLLDLKEIFDYIAGNSHRYATITTNKIYLRVQVVAQNPYIGRIADEFKEQSIRELIEGNYRIIYRIKTDSQVDVLRIYHSARLLRRNEID